MEEPAPVDAMIPPNTEETTAVELPEPKDADFSPTKVVDTKPEDVRFLTIKNLDTGEEFVIGENDPDFEFDTFEIGGKQGDAVVGTAEIEMAPLNEEASAQERISWWRTFFRYLYGSKQSNENIEEKVANATQGHQQSNRSKTPFTKLSSFKIRRELGRGAFGRVLLAEAKTDGKLYALKIISKKNMRSSDKRQAKAERDILFAMTLKSPHPFTSGLKFAFQSENNLYLGMDFIPGGNLRELIKRFKFLPEDWVQFYAAELILAISHLHSLNVLYRDIKPHNVMIDGRGHLILIDFGLSKQEISHPRGALSLVGTPDYSAPEVLRTGVQQIEAHNRERAMRAANSKGGNTKKKNKTKNAVVEDTTLAMSPHIGYGKAADWWSLGIMIYEMIGGKPTFRGTDLRETYQRILYSKLEFQPEERFSPSAKILLEGLIHRDPSQRLGAWDNPPRDIMNTAFFAPIEWDAIYERRQDGPYVPEIPSFLAGRKHSTTTVSSKAAAASVATAVTPVEKGGGEAVSASSETAVASESTAAVYQPLVFSPWPTHRMTNPHEDSTKDTQPVGPKPQAGDILREGDKLPVDIGEGDEDDDEDEDNEELHMRDSVFVFSHGGMNKLPDWSYIDENVLAEYLTGEQEKKDAAESLRTGSEKKVVQPRKSGENIVVAPVVAINADVTEDTPPTASEDNAQEAPVASATVVAESLEHQQQTQEEVQQGNDEQNTIQAELHSEISIQTPVDVVEV